MSEDLIKKTDVINTIHDYWKLQIDKLPRRMGEYGIEIVGDCNTLLKYNRELSLQIKALPSARLTNGILLKGNVKEGIYTLKKTTNGWVLEGENIAYTGFDVDDTPEINAELRADFLKRQYEAALEEIEKLKANRPQGKWIVETDDTGNTYGRCPICGMRQYAGQLNYCPDCGTKMEGASDDTI